jgi:hypothetical protein
LWFQTPFSCIAFAGMTCFRQKLLHHLEFIHSYREFQTPFSCIAFAGMTCFSQKLLHHLEFIQGAAEKPDGF